MTDLADGTVEIGAACALPEPITVVPRWEWRTISQHTLAPHVLGFDSGVRGHTVHETYILSSVSPHNIKIRDGCLEVKRLEQVDATGLERWRPVVKAAFPLDAAAVAEAFDAWKVHAFPLSTEATSNPAAFLAAVTGARMELQTITITKQLAPLELLGCQGEHVDLVIADALWESVAFENADPALVRAAIAYLGFCPSDNTSYPTALKHIVSGRSGTPSRALEGAS